MLPPFSEPSLNLLPWSCGGRLAFPLGDESGQELGVVRELSLELLQVGRTLEAAHIRCDPLGDLLGSLHVGQGLVGVLPAAVEKEVFLIAPSLEERVLQLVAYDHESQLSLDAKDVLVFHNADEEEG